LRRKRMKCVRIEPANAFRWTGHLNEFLLWAREVELDPYRDCETHVSPENLSLRVYRVMDNNYNQRVDLFMELGDWVICEDGHPMVLTEEAFRRKFRMVDPPPTQVIGIGSIESAEKFSKFGG